MTYGSVMRKAGNVMKRGQYRHNTMMTNTDIWGQCVSDSGSQRAGYHPGAGSVPMDTGTVPMGAGTVPMGVGTVPKGAGSVPAVGQTPTGTLPTGAGAYMGNGGCWHSDRWAPEKVRALMNSD